MHTRLLAALLASLFLLLPARAEDDPMKPVYGTWTVDMDATLKENSALSAEMLRMAKMGYEQNPFTLTITEKEYISKGRQKTMVDLYRVAEVKNGRITLELLAKEGAAAGRDNDRQRKANLIPHQGALLIRIDEIHFVFVLKRVPEEKKDAEKPDAAKEAPAKEK
jgi:hypothetical protein